jgi:hypothetical protein
LILALFSFSKKYFINILHRTILTLVVWPHILNVFDGNKRFLIFSRILALFLSVEMKSLNTYIIKKSH